MARRILLINPIGVDIFDQLTVDLVRPDLREDTEVVCRSLDGVPRSPSLASPAQFHNQLITMVAGAAGEGFDAVGISCCGDPALSACKSVSTIPVTAPFEAVCAAARSLGPFTVLRRTLPPAFAATMPTQRNGHWMRHLVRSYGIAPDDVSFRTVPVASHPSPEEVAELADRDPGLLREKVLAAMAEAAAGAGLKQTLAAAEDDGATAVFFACTFWGGLLGPVREQSPIAVLDPLTVVAKYTEYLATIV
ncbi:aspartate/glutamate racemase family protein [Phytohabitans kaempferiae]|uniref:Aspartate/glutamate racemase family protein n=1 Tax=Phytohabitans kaempferiae TaxID=1620943 RepID=A0ABV6M6E4_9ACTN